MTDGVSNEPVVSAPAPISVEPRSAAPAEVAEVARQAEEAKLPSPGKPEAKAAEPAKAEAKPRSIKEALAAAREKLDAEPASPLKVAAKEAPAAKAAEPAAVAKDAPAAKAEPVAAKEAPAAKTEPAVTRGEDGKFVSTKPAEPGAKADSAPPAADAAEPAKPSHTAEPAPKRFSAEAKEEWAAAPEKVRAEVARMEKELTAGFEKHRASAESFEAVREFDEMAKRGNTTLKEALSKYVGMEQQLRADPVKGLELIAKNVGLNLQELAAKVLGKTPDQARVESDATIRDLTARLERAEQGIGTIHQERQQAATDTTTASVTAFAADPAHSRFEELAEDIALFLKTKTKDLAEAYKLAERLNPAPAAQPAAVASSAPAAVPARPTLVPPAPASTAGEKSIAGTPTAGSDPVRKQPSNSIREAIRKATAAAR